MTNNKKLWSKIIMAAIIVVIIIAILAAVASKGGYSNNKQTQQIGNTVTGTGTGTGTETGTEASTGTGTATPPFSSSSSKINYSSIGETFIELPTPQTNKMTRITISRDPAYIVFTVTSIVIINNLTNTSILIDTLTQKSQNTTEYLTFSGIMTTVKITAIGKSGTATIYSGSKTITDTHWVPYAFNIIVPFQPYAIINGTTLFTAVGNVLDTTTMYIKNGSMRASHIYIVSLKNKQYTQRVIIHGTYSNPLKTTTALVYTALPTFTYPWIVNSNTFIVPTSLASGIIDRQFLLVVSSTMYEYSTVYSVAGLSSVTFFKGYNGNEKKTIVNSLATVIEGYVDIIGTLSGNSFIITVSNKFTTTSGISVLTISVASTKYATRFTLLTSIIGMNTIVINSTPVLVVLYTDTQYGIVIPVTLGMDIMIGKQMYRIVTNSNGNYYIVTTFILNNIVNAKGIEYTIG